MEQEAGEEAEDAEGERCWWTKRKKKNHSGRSGRTWNRRKREKESS